MHFIESFVFIMKAQQRPVGYSQNTIGGPGGNMIPRGPQPSYSPVRHSTNNQNITVKQRPNTDNRGPPSSQSNKRFHLYIFICLPSIKIYIL